MQKVKIQLMSKLTLVIGVGLTLLFCYKYEMKLGGLILALTIQEVITYLFLLIASCRMKDISEAVTFPGGEAFREWKAYIMVSLKTSLMFMSAAWSGQFAIIFASLLSPTQLAAMVAVREVERVVSNVGMAISSIGAAIIGALIGNPNVD